MRVEQFLKEDIWKTRVETLSKPKAFIIRSLRLVMLTIQGFTKSQVQQGASSLTYYSLLSIVPMIALMIGIARGFLLEDSLRRSLIEKFSSQEDILNQLFAFADSSLRETKEGLIAGLGVIILFWSAIKILTNIELVMNEIWEVKHARSFAKKFSDYLAMMVICPIILIASSTLTVYLSARLAILQENSSILSEIGPVLFPMLNLMPYLLNCALFTFLYIFMPNTNVRFKPALYAGLITGSIYQIVQWAYLYFQIGVASYNAIYGTFAALPLFLIWLHLSWVIFLLGAKVAFAFQNVDAYEFITEDFSLSNKSKEILCLRITHYCIRGFCDNKAPPTKVEISNRLAIPLFLTHHLLIELVKGGVLSEVQGDTDEEDRYQPALDVDQLTIKRILDMIDQRGQSIPLPPTPEVAAILKSLEEFSALIERSDANIPLKNVKLARNEHKKKPR